LSDIHDLHKTKTALLHEQLERLPFFEALETHKLPKLSIVSYLRCLAIVHAVLEGRFSRIPQHQVSRLHGSTLPKLALLTADLEVLDAASLPSIAPATRAALDYADEIIGEADPLNLIGPLYVLEGSQNGAITLKHQYAHCLNIPDKSLSYFGCYGGATAENWDAFLAVLGSLSLGGEQREQIAASAIGCFEGLERICAALYPYAPKDLKYHIAAVNFEAGDHAIPQNPAEIDLALRAGKEAWELFPYLEQRYGARGRRFTNSDSCWLVTLTRAPRQEVAAKALDWLRGVLAPRGIPTVILEAHLRAIRQAITLEFPEKVEMRTQFDLFLSNREAERREHFGAGSPLIDQFNRRFKACSGLQVESAAELIASAWIDERSGIAGSLPVMYNWFTDAGRFSTDWIINVDELLAECDRMHVSS
jgi:heme oxygenase